MLSDMDYRQLIRWVQQVCTYLPNEEIVHPVTDAERLIAMISVRTNHSSIRLARMEISKIWANASEEQWEELLFLAETNHVPFPEINTYEQASSLLQSLNQLMNEEDTDIAL